MSTVIFDNGGLKQRGYSVRSIICLDCGKIREQLNDANSTCPRCGSDRFQDNLEFNLLRKIRAYDSFTIKMWIDHLPWLIDIQANKDNMLVASLLIDKLNTLICI